MMRCDACKEDISKKKSTVRKHIASAKHKEAKTVIQNSKKRDQSLLTFLRKTDEKDHSKGETLPEDMRIFRFDLVKSFFYQHAGIPLSKIDHLRSFLEKYGHRLTAQCSFVANYSISNREGESNTKKRTFNAPAQSLLMEVQGWGSSCHCCTVH